MENIMTSLKALEGKYLIVDTLGEVRRIETAITSWAARTYQVRNGKLVRVA